MNPSVPVSALVTISPAAAPALWHFSVRLPELHPLSFSVVVSAFEPLYSPLIVPLAQVTFLPDCASTVSGPVGPVIFLASAPGYHSNALSLLESSVVHLISLKPPCTTRFSAGTFLQRPSSGSDASTATKWASATATSPFMIAVLWPAAAGSPASRSTAGSIRSESEPPHPLTPGAGKALSASDTPVSRVIPKVCPNVPVLPLIGWLGGGGFVVPVVRLSDSGSDAVPM